MRKFRIRESIAVKKYIFMILLLSFLSACSLDKNAAELYKQETPLKLEIQTPDTFTAGERETIKATLTQDGKPAVHADFVHFEIWKLDGTVQYGMEEAVNEGSGVYSISKDFDKDGLYYVKVHAQQGDSLIMPQKQFIVGELSKSDMEFLQEGTGKQEAVQGHHH
ncbi:YtkA-like protein [Cytobacillus firmus]|uniref:YtkA-like protein n=2 Tax=Cytobacillus TaxID=2675230 RepID=A0A366JW98_CYTFI|nr:FixH family protein [Cytobacillus firmus]RBP92955.1 YtkA-like protein [Cytobacillus firmus]TDX42557.1 YtkA-like protein [Cytobacillus oceanisediminis]